MENYVEGVVDKWCGGFGFITYRHSGRDCRVFFHNGSIRPDEIGRTSQCWIEQTLVRFKVTQVVHRGKDRTVAVDVHPIFADEPLDCPGAHREVSSVVQISSSRNSMWLMRESGEQIYLRVKHVLPQYIHRFQGELREGDFVFHGVVENPERDPIVWEATEAEIFSREENDRLRRGELLTDPPPPESEPQAEIEAEPLPEILNTANRSKTFLQLIELEKRARHEFPPKDEHKP